jgi:hypothetical protein
VIINSLALAGLDLRSWYKWEEGQKVGEKNKNLTHWQAAVILRVKGTTGLLGHCQT